MSSIYRHALVIGKCLPPHGGHEALIRFAAGMAERVTVLVEQRPEEEFSVNLRVGWLVETLADLPHVTVSPLYGTHPQSPDTHPDSPDAFWKHWRNVLLDAAPTIDVVVTGDAYGQPLAHALEIDWLPFDRTVIPVSATSIKAAPWEGWSYLVAPARRALLRRLLLVGPESTGKSVLSHHLARTAAHPTCVLPEYAQHWLSRCDTSEVTERTLEVFLEAQEAAYHAWSAHASRWWVEDSSALTTGVWAERMGFPELAQRCYDHARQAPPHHTLLLSAHGVPWKEDSHRLRAFDRQAFEALFKQRLAEWHWPHTVIEGSWDERTLKASQVRDTLLSAWHCQSWSEWVS